MADFYAADMSDRMAALEEFLVRWYGTRRPEYGEPAKRLDSVSLPDPLRRFYGFAGRWPAPYPEAVPEPGEFFYTGQAGHHLRNLDDLRVRADGRLDFFMEYQGDWVGLTLPTGEDPPVWIEGRWEEYDDTPADEEVKGEGGRSRKRRLVSDTLSAFLITHCLMTTLYDGGCAYTISSGCLSTTLSQGVKIWKASGACPHYRGEFFRLPHNVLAHRDGSYCLFGALELAGVDWIKKAEKGAL